MLRFPRRMRHAAPLSLLRSFTCAYFLSPRGVPRRDRRRIAPCRSRDRTDPQLPRLEGLVVAESAWSQEIFAPHRAECGSTQYLVQRIRSQHELELLAPAPLTVVCFRFHPPQTSEPRLNSINKELLLRLQESGVAVPSSTILDGKFTIRVAITNHRSRRKDFYALITAVLEFGRAILSDPVPTKRHPAKPLGTIQRQLRFSLLL